MSIFKELTTQDVSYREYYAYKQWVLDEDDSELKVFHAYEKTGSHFYPFPEFEQTGSGGIYKRTVYNSIKHLYYYVDSRLDFTAANFYSQQATGSIYFNDFYAPDHNFGPNTDTIHKNLKTVAVVISVPQAYIGDGMKPGSVQIESVLPTIFTLDDDGYGNLYDSTESASFAANKSGYTRGNIFYEHGNIVITQTGSYQTYGSGSGTDYVVRHKSIHKIYEMEAYCTAKEGEFNLSWNPSLRVSSSLNNPDLLGVVTSSEFCTYPTTIGLYDDDCALIAVGKVAQPIRNDSGLALTFVVRIDW